MDELATRLAPWEPIEKAHALNRPHAERPPLPVRGDQVWFRAHHWEIDPATGARCPPVLVVVDHVQDLNDRDDPNLWQHLRDPNRRPMFLGDMPLHMPVPDPWPRVWLKLPDRYKPDGNLASYGIVHPTREARMRGSAGWLPLDYRQRPERWRLAAETATVARPPLPTPNLTGAEPG